MARKTSCGPSVRFTRAAQWGLIMWRFVIHAALVAVIAGWVMPARAQKSSDAYEALQAGDYCWQKQVYSAGWVDNGPVVTDARNVRSDVSLNSSKNSPAGYVHEGGTDEILVYVYPRRKDSYRWRKVPCPGPDIWDLLEWDYYFGVEGSENWLDLWSLEDTAFPPIMRTNRFHDTNDPLGVGALIGVKLRPFHNGLVVSPFASFDYLNMSVNHTFANGSFLGTRSNYAGTFGLKVGPQLDFGVWLYGIAGVSMLNETLRVNFIPVASSSTTTVPGATIGVGAAWQPTFLQGLGRPISLFAEYQHTWWQDATFNQPAASPFFNYTFQRQDDVLKFGFLVSLNPPTTPAASAFPVKAKAR
jgi:hypothetical protein